MKKIKLLVLVTIWQRPNIFRVMAQNLKFPDWIDATVLAVVSPNDKDLDSNVITCENNEFNIFWADNKPVGNKRNKGLEHALLTYPDWFYYFKIDSDDLLDPNYWDVLKPYLKNGCPFIGMSKYCAYCTESKQAQIVSYKKVIGGGKTIHRRVIEATFKKLGYVYPPTQNGGLDNTSQRNIYESTKTEPVRLTESYLLDLKSPVNINPYRGLKWMPCEPVSYDYILERFGDVQKQLDNVENEQKE